MFTPMAMMGEVTVNINASTDDFVLFSAINSPSNPVRVLVNIASGVEIGSTSTSTAGFRLGSGWHSSSKIRIFNNGTIMGKGGQGATGEGSSNCGAVSGVAPTAGGPALDATGLPATGMLDFTNNGTIGGGGGGGGIGGGGCVFGSYQWSGGGGGSGRGRTATTGGPAGSLSGTPATYYAGNTGGTGTSSAAGQGGRGGNYPGSTNDSDRGGHGGDFGTAGGFGQANGSNYGAGAAAGNATNGDSKINFLVVGTILGSRTG